MVEAGGGYPVSRKFLWLGFFNPPLIYFTFHSIFKYTFVFTSTWPDTDWCVLVPGVLLVVLVDVRGQRVHLHRHRPGLQEGVQALSQRCTHWLHQRLPRGLLNLMKMGMNIGILQFWPVRDCEIIEDVPFIANRYKCLVYRIHNEIFSCNFYSMVT